MDYGDRIRYAVFLKALTIDGIKERQALWD